MPAVVMGDRVGVPGVGQCGLRIDVRQQVAGRVVFAQLVPGVERTSDAVPGVVGALGHHVGLHCGRGGEVLLDVAQQVDGVAEFMGQYGLVGVAGLVYALGDAFDIGGGDGCDRVADHAP